MHPISQANSVMSEPEEYLRRTLAACSEWQDWLGVSTDEEALERIYTTDVPPPANQSDAHQEAERRAQRPCAIIYTSPRAGFTVRRIADGANDENGRLVLVFEMDVPAHLSANSGELVRQFQNRLGRIIRRKRGDEAGFVGLMDLAWQPGYLTIDRIDVEGPFEPDEVTAEGEGSYLFAYFLVRWGGAQ